MRMWMTDPRQMCRQHLLGEHRELHTLVGTIRSPQMSIEGWVRDAWIAPRKIVERHAELVEEFRRRDWPSGKNHETPIGPLDLSALPDVPIDLQANRADLASRCAACRQRM